MGKIFIYSIQRPTATGLSEWKDETSGKPLGKTKLGKANDGVQALRKSSVGGLANYISYHPWIDPVTGLQVKDETGKPLTMQDQMERKWNKPPGFFTNKAWEKGDSFKEEDRTYFQKARWKMQDGCTVLDMDNMDDELGYYVMLDSKFVANSEKEWRSHKWPDARWYIALENESDELKYARNQVRSKAFAALHAPDFDDSTKRKFLTILNVANAKSVLTDQQVHNLLYEYIDKSSLAPGSNIDKFNQLFALLSTAAGKQQIYARFVLKQGLDTNVLYEKQNSYFFNRPTGQINIGDRYEDAVDFILSPKKEKEVEELQKMIKDRL